MEKHRDKMIKVYQGAYNYLLEIKPDEISEEELQKYFVVDSNDFSTLEEIFDHFIGSAQNYQSMPNIIKYDLRKNEIKKMLADFDVQIVKKMDASDLYYQFREKFNVTSKDSKQNSWYKWSRAVVDSAKFLSDFKDADDFKDFVNGFNYNQITRMALPLLMEKKIHGVGFALACNTLKDLGFLDYPKPDVHLLDVCSELDLAKRNQIDVFECVVKMANECKVTPYKVDKIIWLICSGRFYLDDINVGGHKKEFIEYMKAKM